MISKKKNIYKQIKTMVVNYKLGKIYCLRSHQTDDIYIGSTAQHLLSVRLGGHRRDYKKWLNDKKMYMTSYEILKYDDCYIELLEDYPCDDKHQLFRKEGEYIRKMDCVNKSIPGRTKKQYRQDNKEMIAVKAKQYREDNKDKEAERQKQWYEKNKDAIAVKIRQYRQDNKDAISEYQKQYYEKNKDKEAERKKQYYEKNKETVKCECGSTLLKHNLKQHKETKKHIEYMESL